MPFKHLEIFASPSLGRLGEVHAGWRRRGEFWRFDVGEMFFLVIYRFTVPRTTRIIRRVKLYVVDFPPTSFDQMVRVSQFSPFFFFFWTTTIDNRTVDFFRDISWLLLDEVLLVQYYFIFKFKWYEELCRDM